MDSDGLCTQAQGDYACTYVLWLELFWFEYGCGEGGVSDIFVNYMYCLQTSFSGDFLVVQPNYYFVNCIPIDTNCRLKEKGDGGFWGFFCMKLMTSDTCSIIIRNCICDTLFNMMYSPSQIVPPVFKQVSKFNMAMNSKWKPTSKQVYNHFIFPML